MSGNRLPGTGVSASAGFTLLELLVSLTVLGFIAALAAGALDLGSRVWERTSGTVEALDEAFGAQDFLRELLAATYPAPRGEPGRNTVEFTGTRHSIEFRAPSPLSQTSHGYVPMRLFVDDERNNRRLVLSVGEGGGEGGGDRRLVLLDRLQEAAFGFFGTDDGGTTRAWREDWTDRQRLPGLIRVSISFAPTDPRAWPDLTIAPVVDVDALCRPDPVSGGCEGR